MQLVQQIPIPLIVTGVILVLIIVWKNWKPSKKTKAKPENAVEEIKLLRPEKMLGLVVYLFLWTVAVLIIYYSAGREWQNWQTNYTYLFWLVMVGIPMVITVTALAQKTKTSTYSSSSYSPCGGKSFDFKTLAKLAGVVAIAYIAYLAIEKVSGDLKEAKRINIVNALSRVDEWVLENTVPEGFITLKPNAEWTHVGVFFGVRTDIVVQDPTKCVWVRIDNQNPRLKRSTLEEAGINCRDMWIKLPDGLPPTVVKIIHR